MKPPFLPKHRDEFPALIDAMGLETAAEVGVGEGMYAAKLLESKSLKKFYMIDDWRNPADREKGYRDIAYAVAAGDPRATVVELDCMEFAPTIPDGSIDFVYIDTMHEAPYPMQHIAAWLPKARVILAGHDYVPGNVEHHVVYDIVPTVEHLLGGYEIHVTGIESTRLADRLRAAAEAMGINAGSWGCNVPSWWILKQES